MYIPEFWLSLITRYTSLNPSHGAILPKNKYLAWSSLAGMLRSRLLPILAALGAIFQAFPALCHCEPNLPRGAMQAVPCGAHSNTWLLPASTSQPSPAGICSVRKYCTGICVFVRVKTVLTFDHGWIPRKRKINPPSQPRPQTLSLLPDRAAARAAGERRPVYPFLHPCTSRTGAETAHGGAPPNPTLIRSTCVLLLLILCVAATAALVLLLPLYCCCCC